MNINRDARLQRASEVLRAALDTQAGLPIDDAVVELYVATRSAVRLLSGAYSSIVSARDTH